MTTEKNGLTLSRREFAAGLALAVGAPARILAQDGRLTAGEVVERIKATWASRGVAGRPIPSSRVASTRPWPESRRR